jgi:prepilin-type N-terminal cleavage/methylation domain-containing protein
MKRTPAQRDDAFTLLELTVVIVIVAALAALVVNNVSRTADDAEVVAARATMQTLADAITGSAAGPGYLSDMRHVPGFRPVLLRPHHLLVQGVQQNFDPVAQRGWRGPYLRNAQRVLTSPAATGAFPSAGDRSPRYVGTFFERGFFSDAVTSPYGVPGDLAAADPWGNPIVIQVPPLSAFSGSTGDAKRFRYARLVSAGPDGTLATPLDRLGGMLTDGTSLIRGDDLVLFLNRSDTYETEEP